MSSSNPLPPSGVDAATALFQRSGNWGTGVTCPKLKFVKWRTGFKPGSLVKSKAAGATPRGRSLVSLKLSGHERDTPKGREAPCSDPALSHSLRNTKGPPCHHRCRRSQTTRVRPEPGGGPSLPACCSRAPPRSAREESSGQAQTREPPGDAGVAARQGDASGDLSWRRDSLGPPAPGLPPGGPRPAPT